MSKLNIGIILGSTRLGRVSPQVGEWVKKIADQRGDANYEIVDLAEFKLPFFYESEPTQAVGDWNAKLAGLDGFVFIVQEYNHSMSGVLKNAFDWAREAWNNKAAGIVSYGSSGGVRAAEHVRGVLGELSIADVRSNPALSLYTDFENGSVLKPQEMQTAKVGEMLNEVVAWSGALKQLRK